MVVATPGEVGEVVTPEIVVTAPETVVEASVLVDKIVEGWVTVGGGKVVWTWVTGGWVMVAWIHKKILVISL